jgi:glycosyl transferase family 2
MSNIAYSLLVPTRNRPATAECLVRHALRFFPDDYEIVVQDCGTPGPLREALKDVSSDPRLRYEHTGRLVSMTDNWNRGFERCRGEYMSILGDDDAVTGELPNIVEWMSVRELDALVGNTNRSWYYWPDFPDATKVGSYAMYNYTGEIREYKSKSLLTQAVSSFGYAEVLAMPSVYYGIVRRKYLTSMMERTGQCFQGYTPDLYSSFFLATSVPLTHWVDFPVFVPGACGASNAAVNLSLEAATILTRTIRTSDPGRSAHVHTREFERTSWPDLVPEGSIMQVFVAEGIVRALRDSGRADLVVDMNWPDFYLLCMLHDPAFRWRNLRRYWSESGRVLGRSQGQRVSDLAMGLLRRVQGKVKRRQGYLEAQFAAPRREVFERYSGVRDTTDLVQRQADSLRRQRVVPPWRVPASAATRQSLPMGG